MLLVTHEQTESEAQVSEALLTRIGNGDRTAVAACVDKYGGLVWSLARRFSQTQADAEDAVQEIFISLWKSAERFDSSKSSEMTFVSMVARRRLIDLNRRRQAVSRAVTTQPIDSVEVANSSDVAEKAAIDDQASHALQVLNQLPEDQCQAIKLSVYNGLSHNQIAEQMNLPLGTIKTHIRRGLNKVRDQLRHLVADSGGLA